ncbi:NitT/TauT family transport system substrate-binding protein [Loktanella fryxellensis]|uniref:NitT/TauT family transport system substrate-binding protein n=1 Tax=Loktanella fryxellensis TaxID=245187 RepID=A0A1H8JHH1_9RHOB|nr:ABC transporter substrate-binding protein [Loktanella fryxellensis]SEN80293.1 NitT/TauT family transport system substrate-binding protein [Loktanella fryxellensis]
MGHLHHAALALWLAMAGSVAAQDPTLRAAAQETGTVMWELDTIRHYGLDAANGFTLDVQATAGADAAQIAFQGGAVDVIVSDWIWVARQNAAGEALVFIPFSRAVGGLLVPQDSTAQTLADIDGGRIGVAGGRLDKGWIILQAYAQQTYGLDLAAATTQVFGAPPLIMNAATTGQLEGAINVWHFMARMQAEGMRELISIADAATALGLDPATPLLGYVVRAKLLEDNPALVAGLARASQQAKAVLADDSAAWARLRTRMGDPDDAAFAALQAGFAAGKPLPGPVDVAAAQRMLALMSDLGGPDLVGDVTALPEAMFYTLPPA